MIMKFNILKRQGETTKQAVRRRVMGYEPAPLPPARRVVQVAERILRQTRAV